jgi:hypothetical protein
MPIWRMQWKIGIRGRGGGGGETGCSKYHPNNYITSTREHNTLWTIPLETNAIYSTSKYFMRTSDYNKIWHLI